MPRLRLAAPVQDRYARQRTFLGRDAQKRIRDGKALVVGLGGLGCPAATYLAGAGVGTVGLADFDGVELSNLPRQPLYTTEDVGRPKVEAARDRLEALNPDCILLAIPQRVGAENAGEIVRGFDVVLDCTDSMEARYALSDACAAARIPLVQAGIAAGEGEVATLCGADGPCYRCIHPVAEEGPTCAEEGVLGPLAGLLGSLQALWALQIVSGSGPAAVGRMELVASDGSSQTIALKKRDGCKAHMQPTGDPLVSIDGTPDGPACPLPWNAPQGPDIAVQDYAEHRPDFFLLDVREPDEHEEFAIGGDHLIPLRDLPQRVGEVPQERAIVVYCAVGGRSGRAAEWLRQRGYKAYNLRGGVRAWMMAGLAGR